MTNKRSLYGVELRYVLTFYLSQNGRATVADLIEALDYYGFDAAFTAPARSPDRPRIESVSV
jgi:hypothetical protein